MRLCSLKSGYRTCSVLMMFLTPWWNLCNVWPHVLDKMGHIIKVRWPLQWGNNKLTTVVNSKDLPLAGTDPWALGRDSFSTQQKNLEDQGRDSSGTLKEVRISISLAENECGKMWAASAMPSPEHCNPLFQGEITQKAIASSTQSSRYKLSSWILKTPFYF